MSNLIVDIIPLKVDRLLVESSMKSGGPLVVVGVIQRAGIKNHNGRIYERAILEREMNKYMEGPIKQNNALGELDHPDSSVINLNNVSHKINKCWCTSWYLISWNGFSTRKFRWCFNGTRRFRSIMLRFSIYPIYSWCYFNTPTIKRRYRAPNN